MLKKPNNTYSFIDRGELYSSFSRDELWCIKENEWARSLQAIRESQFSLGNGYLGTRGILEELPYDSSPGIYIAGIYDKTASQVAELVNLPNPINFHLTVKGGEKVGLIAMDNLEHRRLLNMKRGILARKTLYKDTKGRRYDYQSLRFLSMSDKNIGVMRISFTSLDASCTLDLNTGIDTSVFNAGILSEGRKKHFRIRELGQARNSGFLLVETLEKKNPIIFWSGFYYEINGKKVYAKDNIFRLHLKKNQTITFTKVFCIKHFPHYKSYSFCKDDSFKIFRRAYLSSFSKLLASHTEAWAKLWRRADVQIEGTASLQQNLRFNIYHMLISAHYDKGFSSIGARTLSGEGYRGHIFWDAEIFLMPFYLCTFPRIAKNMLLYRCRRLDKARDIAKTKGYRGAKFPWESAGTGQEETPGWAKDIDGTVIKIHTHKFEDHITCDIAYALHKYYIFTQDEEFMAQYGYELFFASARFWASRVSLNKKTNRYDINRIIGPDEFHVDVNNNAYTNMMAKWNLIAAYKLFTSISKKTKLCKNLIRRLGLTQKEVKQWRKIASKITINVDKNKVIEQFDGYFRLKKVIPTKTDENGIPVIPAKLKTRDVEKTQLVKQADILVMLHLLGDIFNSKTKKANYDFYMPRTVHRSSLSPSMNALLACEVGDLHKAYSLFNTSLRTDISNLHGNTHEGIHGACLGGTWQAVVFGFGGVSIKREVLFINPRMPRTWGKMVFSLSWQQSLVKLELNNETLGIKVSCSKKKSIPVGIFGKVVILKTNRVYRFRRGFSFHR